MVLQTRTGSNASLWNALVFSKHLWHIHIRKVATSFFFFYYPLKFIMIIQAEIGAVHRVRAQGPTNRGSDPASAYLPGIAIHGLSG